jgi:hypothetical protein
MDTVSSTFEDLKNERHLVAEALAKAGYMPAGMEFFPAVDEEQLKYIERVIDRSDFYVVIVGGRYGTLAADKVSFTEKEFEHALKRQIPVLALLHANPDTIEVGRTDKKKTHERKLEAFRKRLSGKGVRMVAKWKDPQDLCMKIIIALNNQAHLSPRAGWVRGDQAIDPKTMQEMERIRTENDELKRRLAQFDASPEQPFIYGGFGRRFVEIKEDGVQITAQVTMANYGKAPGFIKYIEVGRGNLDDGLPSLPEYLQKFDILDLYFPDMKMEDVRPTRAVIDIPGGGRHVVFQRVWYTDLADNLYFSGSIYRLEVVQQGDKTHVIDETILPGTAYWNRGKVTAAAPLG